MDGGVRPPPSRWWKIWSARGARVKLPTLMLYLSPAPGNLSRTLYTALTPLTSVPGPLSHRPHLTVAGQIPAAPLYAAATIESPRFIDPTICVWNRRLPAGQCAAHSPGLTSRHRRRPSCPTAGDQTPAPWTPAVGRPPTPPHLLTHRGHLTPPIAIV